MVGTAEKIVELNPEQELQEQELQMEDALSQLLKAENEIDNSVNVDSDHEDDISK